ncbi:hypothetical protein K9U39_13235 [Rhodoblastus acidophilus]|uniref:Uncharacterized protein n=1 Tax=Candidatus Rhodoblastus alkanivorans TaxID=2954117 RepID=A0ABS9ZAB2_9HYPH|nr:hypothetical protein [Candidatus Rhodoblastus alkanivorans]MCI4684574.1 hypothetical protein [Candidatus Rhodoblastus alkanivorans]MDI4641895.1 hypothetical protein [Rhodoblastus acidophilus]
MIDLDKMTVKATIPVSQRPRGIVASPDNGKIHVVLGDSDSIAIIDPQKLVVTEKLPAGRDCERGDVSPDGKVVAATTDTTNMVHFVDASTRGTLADLGSGHSRRAGTMTCWRA